ncbi:hypothetical protein [Corynebacterium glutamicum]|uniref:hypothetical protein n=1 Tax=Corynebacterium glutamicum TaxID=1718 RepID=UPI001B8C273F|nr:hypothetical protein [Corynebacterium glutamicum]
MSPKDKYVTISFFELVVAPDGKRVLEVDWDTRLEGLRDPEMRIVEYNSRDLDGVVMGGASDPCLSLTIDRVTRPRERQRGTGVRRTMRNSGDDFDPAEETVVVFFERNIFGTLNTGQGAPSHAAVAAWLNTYSRPAIGDSLHSWSAKQITREDIYNAVIKQKNMSVTASTFTVEPGLLEEEDLGILGILSDYIFDPDSGLTMKISLQAGRTKKKHQNAQYIEEKVDEIMNSVPVKGASVRAKTEDGPQRAFNLLSESVTHKIAISHRAFESEEDFIDVANREIRSAYAEMSNILLERVPKISR